MSFVWTIIPLVLIGIMASVIMVEPVFADNDEDGQFNYPVDVAFDSSGNMYVVDNGNNRIQKFDSDGNFLLKWGTKGNQDGQFGCPNDIAIDSDDRVYVADNCNQRIQVFDGEGKFISKWGEPGTGKGYLLSPTGIILDSDDNVYIVDSNRSTIQKFTNQGEFISIWKTDTEKDVCPVQGVTYRGPPCLFGIADISIDSNGDFFIIKRLANSLEKISSSEGTILGNWRLVDNENNQQLYPEGIVIDSVGDLYITSGGARPFLYKYSSDGEFITKWLRKDMTSSFYVGGVAIDSFDNVYVPIGELNVVEKYTTQGKMIGKIGKSSFENKFSHYSPLKQHYLLGVPLNSIICKEDLVMVVKYNYNPACIKPGSIFKLVERGWIGNTSINGGNPMECYLKPDPGVCNADITKYYFDWESQSCKPFSWNGCRGTVPFDRYEACTSLCS